MRSVPTSGSPARSQACHSKAALWPSPSRKVEHFLVAVGSKGAKESARGRVRACGSRRRGAADPRLFLSVDWNVGNFDLHECKCKCKCTCKCKCKCSCKRKCKCKCISVSVSVSISVSVRVNVTVTVSVLLQKTWLVLLYILEYVVVLQLQL